MMQKMRSLIIWLPLMVTLVISKKCCDSDCHQAISYGKTVSRFITRDPGLLSYPMGATVAVFIKDVNVRGVDMWDAEIQGKRGYIRPGAVNELTFKCHPTDVDIEPSDEVMPTPTIVAGTTFADYLEGTPPPSVSEASEEAFVDRNEMDSGERSSSEANATEDEGERPSSEANATEDEGDRAVLTPQEGSHEGTGVSSESNQSEKGMESEGLEDNKEGPSQTERSHSEILEEVENLEEGEDKENMDDKEDDIWNVDLDDEMEGGEWEDVEDVKTGASESSSDSGLVDGASREKEEHNTLDSHPEESNDMKDSADGERSSDKPKPSENLDNLEKEKQVDDEEMKQGSQVQWEQKFERTGESAILENEDEEERLKKEKVEEQQLLEKEKLEEEKQLSENQKPQLSEKEKPEEEQEKLEEQPLLEKEKIEEQQLSEKEKPEEEQEKLEEQPLLEKEKIEEQQLSEKEKLEEEQQLLEEERQHQLGKEKQELEQQLLEKEKLEREQKGENQEQIAGENQERIERESQERIVREKQERFERENQERFARESQERIERENQEKILREKQELFEREQERIARESQERIERENQEKFLREKQELFEREQERIARESQERIERENQEKILREKQELFEREQERIARESQERIKRESQERIERENQEKILREKQERFEREQERIERENQERITRENQEGIVRENQERIARENQERIARENQERIASENQERIARENQERIARENQERIAREKAISQKHKENENQENDDSQERNERENQEERLVRQTRFAQKALEEEKTKAFEKEAMESERMEKENGYYQARFNSPENDERDVVNEDKTEHAEETDHFMDASDRSSLFLEVSGDEKSCDSMTCGQEVSSNQRVPRLYDCRNEYLPLPMAHDSIIVSLVEYLRVTVRESIFAILPEKWSNWICSNRPALGMVVVALICVSLTIPFFTGFCMVVSSRRSLRRDLKQETSLHVTAEGKLKEAVTAQKELKKQVEEFRSNSQVGEDNLRTLHAEMEGLRQEKANLEAHNQTICATLEQTQHKVEQCLQDSEQLRAQLAVLQQQQAGLMADKARAMEENKALSGRVSEFRVSIQGLEATKEQLEADRFTAQTDLDKLEKDHQQVLKEKELLEGNHHVLEAELTETKASLEQLKQQVAEQNSEMETLRRCLLQVTQEEKDGVESEGTTDGNGVAEEEGVGLTDGGEVENEEEADKMEDKSKARLMRIETMLNTTKLQKELQEVKQQRDEFRSTIHSTTSQLEQACGENGVLKSQVRLLEQQLKESSDSRSKLDVKLAVITEYFQKKEMDLHSKLEVGEQARRKIVTFASETEEKDRARAEERVKEKEQLDQLRQQMKDLELSYVSQVKNHEKRANEATTQLQRVEQELRQSMREVTLYKKKVAEMEASVPPPFRPVSQGTRARPPSTGPSAVPQSAGAASDERLGQDRPVSAPRLDRRTSSPVNGGVASSQGSARDIMNMSQPVQSSSEVVGRPSSAVNLTYDETLSSGQNQQRSVITPDPKVAQGSHRGPSHCDGQMPPPLPPAAYSHRAPLYPLPRFYPRGPPAFRPYFAGPPPFRPLASGPTPPPSQGEMMAPRPSPFRPPAAVPRPAPGGPVARAGAVPPGAPVLPQGRLVPSGNVPSRGQTPPMGSLPPHVGPSFREAGPYPPRTIVPGPRAQRYPPPPGGVPTGYDGSVSQPRPPMPPSS